MSGGSRLSELDRNRAGDRWIPVPLPPPLARSRQFRFAPRLRGDGLTGWRAVARWASSSNSVPNSPPTPNTLYHAI